MDLQIQEVLLLLLWSGIPPLDWHWLCQVASKGICTSWESIIKLVIFNSLWWTKTLILRRRRRKKKQNNLTLSYLPNSANHLLLFMELMVLNFHRSFFLILMNALQDDKTSFGILYFYMIYFIIQTLLTVTEKCKWNQIVLLLWCKWEIFVDTIWFLSSYVKTMKNNCMVAWMGRVRAVSCF